MTAKPTPSTGDALPDAMIEAGREAVSRLVKITDDWPHNRVEAIYLAMEAARLKADAPEQRQIIRNILYRKLPTEIDANVAREIADDLLAAGFKADAPIAGELEGLIVRNVRTVVGCSAELAQMVADEVRKDLAALNPEQGEN